MNSGTTSGAGKGQDVGQSKSHDTVSVQESSSQMPGLFLYLLFTLKENYSTIPWSSQQSSHQMIKKTENNR